MIPWLNSNFKNFKPTAAIALNATRHMNTMERKKLFSPDIEPMRTAEGRWFEAIVYEMFLEISQKSDCIKYIARKGADAPRASAPACLGQNGIFYSKYGDITFRGNGQDLAEFDLILVDANGNVAFGEVVTSPADLKEFEIEIAFKKRLLGYLYGQEHVSFLLISSFDISNYSVVKRLAKDPDNAIIHTSSCEQIKALVKHYRPRILYTKPTNHPKLIRATDIPVKHPIDYRLYHDEFRNRIFSEITHGRGRKNAEPATEHGSTRKKDPVRGALPACHKGSLRPVRPRGQGQTYRIRGIFPVFLKSDHRHRSPRLRTDHLPSVPAEKEYLKMVQTKEGHFRFERPTPARVGFFLWIESLQPSLGTRSH